MKENRRIEIIIKDGWGHLGSLGSLVPLLSSLSWTPLQVNISYDQSVPQMNISNQNIDHGWVILEAPGWNGHLALVGLEVLEVLERQFLLLVLLDPGERGGVMLS